MTIELRSRIWGASGTVAKSTTRTPATRMPSGTSTISAAAGRSGRPDRNSRTAPGKSTSTMPRARSTWKRFGG